MSAKHSESTKRPREFWILERQMSNGDYSALDRREDGYEIHVIEYSAYDQLRAEVERLREALNDVHIFCDEDGKIIVENTLKDQP